MTNPASPSVSPPSTPVSGAEDATAGPARSLACLRGLRSAPALDPAQRQQLRLELEAAMAPCRWFTVGVMAPSAEQAVAALRRCEAALGWQPLQAAEPAGPQAGEAGEARPLEGPVFLKGNQRTGLFLVRQETGLGEGLLISGQEADDASAADTWGPLPLDLFA